jgi:hypothetical protein
MWTSPQHTSKSSWPVALSLRASGASSRSLAQGAGQEWQRYVHPVIDIGVVIVEFLLAVLNTSDL